jgi:hypothetical protein
LKAHHSSSYADSFFDSWVISTKQVDYTASFVQAPIDCNPDWDQMTSLERE